MGCEPEKLTDEEVSMLHTLNWMEVSYGDTCWVMDVDFKVGSVALYGPKVQEFRQEFNKIMTAVYEKVPAWREW